MLKDPSIYEKHLDDEHETILVSDKHCSELYNILDDFEFLLHHTLITIKPEGYLYS